MSTPAIPRLIGQILVRQGLSPDRLESALAMQRQEGGLIGEVLLDDEVEFGWDLEPFLLSVLGAVALLLVLRIRR